MESAKAAISNLLSKSGHHDTEVDETVQPAVTEETVKPTRHENVTQAVDREVHQDHFHTTVQPLQHQEVLPEQHSSNVVPVEEREFYHGNDEDTKQRLAAEAAKFKDVSTTAPTQQSQAELPVAVGEHVHHHVHETVQPVVHKETIVPEVVHTVVPIHETHTAPSEHHGLSVLPTRTLNEFQQHGGSLAGTTETRHENYEGDPRPYNADLQQEREPADINPEAHDGMHDLESTGHSRPGTSTTSGVGGASTVQTSTLAGVDARDGPASSTMDSGVGSERYAHAGGATGAQTGALAGATSTPSRTAGGVGSAELNPAVGGSSGAQTGALAGAATTGAAATTDATFGGGGVFHTDPVADHTRVTGSSGAGTVEHFTEDPVSADQTTSRKEVSQLRDESTNEMSEPEQQTPEPSNVKDDALNDDVQHASKQGRDPNTEGPDHPKMTGTGAPGSHSAFFGLTPDGKKDENTKAGTTPIHPAHSDGHSNTQSASEDQGSRGVTGAGVADQMNDPRVAESAHGGDSQQARIGAGDKIGSGSSLTTPSQGTGTVKPSEPGTGGEKATLADKADPNTDADGDGKAGIAD